MMRDRKENPLKTEAIPKLLLKFAIPSIIAMLSGALYNIVDQFFIGNSVGILGNAATNVAFPIQITCVAISLLCGIGGAANFNLNLGMGNKEKAKSFAGNTVFLLSFLGILLTLFVFIFLKPLLLLCGATADVMPYAVTYTKIIALGFPFVILTTGGSNLIRADGSPAYSMICTLAGAILNTVLDPLFIFGFDMGIAGAAWATVLSQVISAAMVIIYLCRFRSLKIDVTALLPKAAMVKGILALGAAPCFNQIAMMVVQIVLNNTLTYYGGASVYGSEIPLACAGIISKVNMVFFSIMIGMAQGLQPIVGFNYGAKEYHRVKEAYKKAVITALGISAVFFLSFQIFPREIISWFGSGSEEYYRFAENYFRIFLFFTFVNGLQPLTSNFFTAIGKAKKGIFLSLTRQIIFLLPLILLLPLFLGIDGVMYAAPIADFAAAVFAVYLAVKEFRTMEK